MTEVFFGVLRFRVWALLLLPMRNSALWAVGV